MSQIITNDEGEEVEVFTKDELEAERVKLQEQLEGKDEELKKLKDKDFNFEQLRKKNEKIEQEKTQKTQEEQDRISQLSQRLDELAVRPDKDMIDDYVKENIGDDKDKKDLFDHYFKKLSNGLTGREELRQAAEDAMKIVNPTPTASAGSLTRTGVSSNFRAESTGGYTEQAKEMGKSMFGLTDEDYKKYGKGSKLQL